MVLSVAFSYPARTKTRVIEITRAQPGDVYAIHIFWSKLIGDNTSRAKIYDMIEDRRGRRDRVLVLRINGNMRGFIAYNLKNGSGHIAGIAVTMNIQERGYGGMLLEAMEKDLKANGNADVILEVKPDNENAIKFYVKNGYEPDGSLPGFYGKGMDALVYKKRLL